MHTHLCICVYIRQTDTHVHIQNYINRCDVIYLHSNIYVALIFFFSHFDKKPCLLFSQPVFP